MAQQFMAQRIPTCSFTPPSTPAPLHVADHVMCSDQWAVSKLRPAGSLLAARTWRDVCVPGLWVSAWTLGQCLEGSYSRELLGLPRKGSDILWVEPLRF